MRIIPRKPAVVVLLALVASLVGVIAPPAAHAEEIPDLQHPPITVGDVQYNRDPVVSPTGNVTLPCDSNNGDDLRSYDSSGQLIQQIPRSPSIDGVENCLNEPIVDKNGGVYGVPYGQKGGGGWGYGPNLLAYDGNTLKWKYPLTCSTNGGASYVVGADGNIYATTRESNGDVHLIGLTPEVVPPLTEPAKVLDVVIPVSCATHMYAYKDGVMVHDQLHGDGWYYSYNGQFLGQASIGDIWYEKLNAQGQLFVASYVGGSPQSANISMYDPHTDKVMWTTSASTSGASTNGVWLTPLAGGGVAAIIREWKMVAPGVPATPEEWVDTFVVINSAGQKIKSVQLPNQNPNNPDDIFSNNTIVNADSTGKAIVVRVLRQKTDDNWPNKVPAISIQVYDPANDTWPYAEVMSGNSDGTEDLYGYELDWSNAREAAAQPTGANTLTLRAHCRWSCPNNDSDQKIYSVEVNGLGVDYPRSVVVDSAPSVPYVALGDSYSSGEGVLPFEEGTETSGTNECHRSHFAYARVIGRSMDNAASLGMGGFHACSGAVTGNITTTGQYNEDPQVDHLDADTKVVTLTIGGNDVKFKEFATACVSNYCGVGNNAYNTSLGEIDNNLGAKLTATYQAILNAAPNAQVYVLGYPHVIPDKAVDDPPPPSGATCAYLYDFGGTAGWSEAQAARHIVAQLNAKISAKVTGMNTPRLHYIDPNASASPFAGHTVCADSGESYFYNIDQGGSGNFVYIFHPNQRGQAAYAHLVAEALN